MYFFIFFAELFFIFLTSRFIIKKISQYILGSTKSRLATVWIVSLFFMSGTVIHELAHYITATFLFVRTGKINLIPRLEKENVTLGSVDIEKQIL